MGSRYCTIVLGDGLDRSKSGEHNRGSFLQRLLSGADLGGRLRWIDLSGCQLCRRESTLNHFITLLDFLISSYPTRRRTGADDRPYLDLPFLSPHRHNLFTAHPLPNNLHLRAPPHLHPGHPLIHPLIDPNVFCRRMDV